MVSATPKNSDSTPTRPTNGIGLAVFGILSLGVAAVSTTGELIALFR